MVAPSIDLVLPRTVPRYIQSTGIARTVVPKTWSRHDPGLTGLIGWNGAINPEHIMRRVYRIYTSGMASAGCSSVSFRIGTGSGTRLSRCRITSAGIQNEPCPCRIRAFTQKCIFGCNSQPIPDSSFGSDKETTMAMLGRRVGRRCAERTS